MWQNARTEPFEPPVARPQREAAMNEWLKKNLQQVLQLPAPAVEWLLMVFQAIQVFDDVADGDDVKREDLNAVIWNAFVGFHQNQFFIANSHHLVPLLGAAVLKWQASDAVERAGRADARSFVWRAGYYDLVLMAVLIVHGPKFAEQNAHLVMELYGESFSDYQKEFGNA